VLATIIIKIIVKYQLVVSLENSKDLYIMKLEKCALNLLKNTYNLKNLDFKHKLKIYNTKYVLCKMKKFRLRKISNINKSLIKEII
jgi:hypothetical protein